MPAAARPSAQEAVLEKGLEHGRAAQRSSPGSPWASLCRGEEGFERSAPLVLRIRDASLDLAAIPPPTPGVLLSPQSGKGGLKSPTSKRGGTRRVQGQPEGRQWEQWRTAMTASTRSRV